MTGSWARKPNGSGNAMARKHRTVPRPPSRKRTASAMALKLFIDSDLLLGGSIGKRKRHGR